MSESKTIKKDNKNKNKNKNKNSVIKNSSITFTPSEEQQCIIDNIKSRNNVIVNAVAGSGKTTTILGLAKQCPTKQILQITYNRALKLEVEAKIKKEGLKNIATKTYHGLACTYYDYMARTDDIIQVVVNIDQPFRYRANNTYYNIIVIDEVQDMTELYFKLVYKFLKDIGPYVNILIVGDNFQGIYEFKGADARFLTLANEIFTSHSPFIKLELNTSYRLTNTMSRFINDTIMNKRVKINAPKHGNHVIYYKINSYRESDVEKIVKYVIELISSGEAKEDDIFILAPSVKKIPLLKKLENLLVNSNIKCFVPISDDTSLKDKIIKNKIVFTTFHQSKGRERPYCIVLGFDTSYYKYFEKDIPVNVCANIIYVAASRASKQLVLIEDAKHGAHHFINCNSLKTGLEMDKDSQSFIKVIEIDNTYIDSRESHRDINEKRDRDCQKHTSGVVDLIKFIKEDILQEISEIVNNLFIVKHEIVDENIVEFPEDIETGDALHEEVADINGVVIPAMLDKPTDGRENVLYECLKDAMTRAQFKNHVTLHNAFKNIVYPCITVNNWLYLGNLYLAYRNELYYKITQIKDYNWLTMEIIEKCHSNIKKHISDSIKYEHEIEIAYHSKQFGMITLMGCIDAIDNDIIWEFKCVDKISLEHKVQLIVYSWMWNIQNRTLLTESNLSSGEKQFMLMNFRTGEILELIQNEKKIDRLMELLFINRYLKKTPVSDDFFIKKNVGSVTEFCKVVKTFERPDSHTSLLTASDYDCDTDDFCISDCDGDIALELADAYEPFYYTTEFLNRLKIQELLDICSKENIVGKYHKIRKSELIDHIMKNSTNVKVKVSSNEEICVSDVEYDI
jgi:hypothetical protein